MNKTQRPLYSKIVAFGKWLLATCAMAASVEALADTQNSLPAPGSLAIPEQHGNTGQNQIKPDLRVILRDQKLNQKHRADREALEHEAIPVGMEGSSLAAPSMPVSAKQSTAMPSTSPLRLQSQEDALHNLAEAIAASPQEGNQTRAILMTAAERGDYLPAISWSLSRRYWGLAEILVHNNPARTPPWALLSLALHKRDMKTIQSLIAHPADIPPKEMFQADQYLGRPLQAQTSAITALQINPFDRELRRMYIDSLSRTTSFVNIQGSWQSFNGLQVYGPQLSAHIHISPFWGILLQNENLWQNASPNTQLINPPRMQSRTNLGFFWRTRHWQGEVSAGEYRGLRNNLTGKLELNWQLTDNTNVSTILNYHSQTFQSPALAVAGMANRAQIQIAQTIHAWTANAALGWTQYLGQDGIQQGTDHYGELGAFWRSNLGPWELRVGPFADYHALQRRSGPEGVVAQVLAANDRNIQSVLPGSYADYGLRLQWGALNQALHPGWTPNLQISAYDNSRFGFQYQFNAGISTAVLGPDRLSLDFSQGQGGNGLSLNQQIFSMNYRFYF